MATPSCRARSAPLPSAILRSKSPSATRIPARRSRRSRPASLDLAVVFEWQDLFGGEVLMHDPTVWVTSELHHMHEERPVPIALYNRAGWCKDFAIKSLEQRGLAYRVAYTSDTNGGLRLAVTSGLAIAPISRSNIPAGCRELTAADGFGDIDSSNVVLRRNPNASGEAIDGMQEAIREAFTNR